MFKYTLLDREKYTSERFQYNATSIDEKIKRISLRLADAVD